MKAHRRSILALVLAAAAAASAAEAGAAKGQRLTLPADWTAGTRYRYRATWKREVIRWPVPGPVPASMNVEHTGEVTITVVAKSTSGYDLRWETVLSPASAAPTRVAEGDVDAGGGELWRYALSIPLDLFIETKSVEGPVTLRNDRAVRDLLSQRKREVLRQIMGESSTAALPESEAPAEGWRQHAKPLFYCTKLDLDLDEPESWSEPHPHPDIGEAVPLEHSRQVVGFDPRSPRITVRTVTQPNATKWQAWLERELVRVPAGAEVGRAFSYMMVRSETTCTMDRHSGWPVIMEQRTSSSSKEFEGAETARFELLDGAGTNASRRR